MAAPLEKVCQSPFAADTGTNTYNPRTAINRSAASTADRLSSNQAKANSLARSTRLYKTKPNVHTRRVSGTPTPRVIRAEASKSGEGSSFEGREDERYIAFTSSGTKDTKGACYRSS